MRILEPSPEEPPAPRPEDRALTDTRHEEDPLDEVESLLASILAAIEQDDADLEELVAAHPEHEAELRARLDALGEFRLGANAPKPSVEGFEVERLLGHGGMGEVWLARDSESGEHVALKLLRAGGLSASAARRLQREAEALARLEHPSIVRVRRAGTAAGTAYLALELLEGEGLDEVLRRGPLEVGQVVRWIRDVADALACAHAAGVLHRDVKPANIRITPEGRAVLIDFGLTGGVEASSLSRTGRFLGSPHYASPEQLLGDRREVGPASDVYALGVTLYEALSGRVPFDAPTSPALFRRILTHEAQDLRKLRPDVTPELSAVVGRAMEKRPRDRYRDAAAFRDDLAAVLELRRVEARAPGPVRRLRRAVRRHPAVSSALAVLALTLLAVAFVQRSNVRRERAARAGQARDLVAFARERIERFEEESRGLPELLQRFENDRRERNAAPPDAAAEERLNRLQREVELARARTQQTSVEVLEALSRAEDLDPAVEGPRELRTRLYFERWRAANADFDETLAAFFAERVEALDGEDGPWTRRMRYQSPLDLDVSPGDTRVDAFVFRRLDHLRPGADPRLVAIPQRGLPEGVEPGATVLRVSVPGQGLEAEDLVLEVDGRAVEGLVYVQDRGSGELAAGAVLLAIDEEPPQSAGAAEDQLSDDANLLRVLDAKGERVVERAANDVRLFDPAPWLALHGGAVTVWRNGDRFHRSVGPGLEVRPTANPLWHGAESLVGVGDLRGALVRGTCVLLLLRAPGHLPVRHPLYDPRVVARPTSLELEPAGAMPPEFVRVTWGRGEELRIADREVRVDEYEAFLNAPASERELPVEDLLPELSVPWQVTPDGVAPPDGLRRDLPVFGITLDQAKAYARWRTLRARSEGRPWRFALPKLREWWSAASWLHDRWVYPWGAEFRPRFAKSCFSRADPRPEPGLRFPTDETFSGLYDMAGGVCEFADGWFWEENRQTAVCGGSWVHADPKTFALRSSWGAPEGARFGYVGMRLVLHIEPELTGH